MSSFNNGYKVQIAPAHMVLGRLYTNRFNGIRYFVETFDFDLGEVHTCFGDELELKSIWSLDSVADVFGVLPPEEPKEVPETVSVEALREAWEYVAHEYPNVEQLIKLAQRLS